MKRLALAAALLVLADLSVPLISGESDDAQHVSAIMSVERLVDAPPAGPTRLIVGDSTGAADVDRHRLGGGRWLQISTAADLSPATTADFVERYVRRHGAPEGVLVVHSFPAWYLTAPRRPWLSERLARASALVRLGEAAGVALGAPTLRATERAVRGMPSRLWRARLKEIPASSREAAARLSRLAVEKGFPLVFVETPVREGVLTDAERGKRAEVRAMLAGLPHRLVVVEDEAPSATMRDEMHKSLEGRRAFTARLAQSLSVSGLRTPIGLPAISRRP